MPQPRTELDIPFVAGLEQATRDEARDPSAGFTTLENTVQRKRGAYTKRTGYASLGAQPGTALAALGSHRDEALVAVDGSQLHAYSDAANTWSTRGRIPAAMVERVPLASAGVFRGTVVYDVAQLGGYLVVIYETARALYATVYDADTKAPIRGPEMLMQGLTGVDALQEFRATLVTAGTNFICIYNREDVNLLTREDRIRRRILDTTNIAAGWGAVGDLVAPGGLNLTFGRFLFDACSMSTRFAMVWLDAATVIQVGTWDPAGTPIASTSCLVGAAGTTNTFSVDADESDTMWLARTRLAESDVAIEARNPFSLAVTGTMMDPAFPSQLTGSESNSAAYATAMVRTATARAALVVSGQSTSAGDYERSWIGWQQFEVSGGLVGLYTVDSVAQHLEHTSKPWLTPDGRVHVVAVPYDTFDAAIVSAPVELLTVTNRQRCMYVLDVTDERLGDVHPVASLAPRVNGERQIFYLPRYTRQTADLGGGKRGIVFPSLRSASAETLELAEIGPWLAPSPCELGGLAHFAGGCAWSYDGSKTVEAAFVQAPRVKWFNNVAGSLTGTYLYTAVWEHVDAAGNVHYSEPAAPISVTAAAETVRVRVTTCTVTMRDDRETGTDRVRLVLYRTAAGGVTYYRCAEAWGYDAASTSKSAFVQFSDSMVDATLTQRQRLYTQPGTLGTSFPRRAPPALRCVVQHGDTLAGLSDDRRTIWFSAPVIGGEGQWFSDAFVVEVNDTTPLVGLASFDGRLWAFTRSGVWVIDGQGFVENGSGGYSLPSRVPVDVGCIDARSIVVTPQGALFQSELGIAMLSRAGQVTFFGETVQGVTAAYPVCTSAVLEAAESHVVFTLRSSDGATGVSLVYDYLSGAWTTEAVRSDAACMVQGVYHRGLAAAVSRRAAAVYLDGAAWVGQTVETGWVKVAGMQGFQRIKRLLLLYRTRSPAGLRVSIGYDYEDAYTDVREWNETELPEAQLQIAPVRQRCTAFRVRVEELEPASPELGTGQGLEFTGLRLVVAVKPRPGFAKSQKD